MSGLFSLSKDQQRDVQLRTTSFNAGELFTARSVSGQELGLHFADVVEAKVLSKMQCLGEPEKYPGLKVDDFNVVEKIFSPLIDEQGVSLCSGCHFLEEDAPGCAIHEAALKIKG